MMIWGLLGNLVSVLYFLSPAPTYWKIAAEGSTGEREFWPIICTLLSTAAWLYYGFFATQFSIIGVNFIGFFAHLIYLSIFVLHGPGAKRINASLSFMVMGPITALTFGWRGNPYVVGWVCVALNIVTYAAPIITSKNALASRSLVQMPILVPLMLTINGLVGSLYGYYGVFPIDYFILASKLLGFMIGLGQVMTYGYIKFITTCPAWIPS